MYDSSVDPTGCVILTIFIWSLHGNWANTYTCKFKLTRVGREHGFLKVSFWYKVHKVPRWLGSLQKSMFPASFQRQRSDYLNSIAKETSHKLQFSYGYLRATIEIIELENPKFSNSCRALASAADDTHPLPPPPPPPPLPLPHHILYVVIYFLSLLIYY